MSAEKRMAFDADLEERNLSPEERERISVLRKAIDFAPVGICMFRKESDSRATDGRGE